MRSVRIAVLKKLQMTVKELKECLRHVSSNSEIVFFPEGTCQDEHGDSLLAGIGYFDMEDHTFVYLGEVNIIEDNE